MTQQHAKEIFDYLKKTNQGFCFTHYGLIDLDYLSENFNLK